MLKVAVLGATGYTGAELVRLLAFHPEVKLEILTSRSYVGKEIAAIYPGLMGKVSQVCETEDLDRIAREADLAFIALPHGHAVSVAEAILSRGKKVIDLGADFRLQDHRNYTEWYDLEHGAPHLLPEAVYGLPEVYRSRLKDASLIANPGCYPTSALLALAPALEEGLIAAEGIVIDSKSGVSGAGRQPSTANIFAECNENIHAYGVGRHRHLPEIEQELEKLAGCRVAVTFTPHLVPMTRGILTTAYGRLNKDWDTGKVWEFYRNYYDQEHFIDVLPPGTWPHTKWVWGSNRCQINVLADKRTGTLIVLAAIDNLIKGASGQAIQNMNVIYGFPETTALEQAAIYP